jgi:hypothetical protein
MLTAFDFIRLPYTPDLSEGGIAYACCSLPYTYDRMGGSLLDRMRRIAGGVAVEIAFRRYLSTQNVPFDVEGATPFTDRDRYDVALGGRRCDVKSYMLTHREQIRAIRRDPALFLKAPALVPLDQYKAENHAGQDLYLFAFLLALITPGREDIHKAQAAGQPLYLVHAMPQPWMRPRYWRSLGRLALKSESDQPLSVELGGQNEQRDYVTETLHLLPYKRVEAHTDFYTLACLRISALPEGRLGIYSPARAETYLIGSYDWGNIWIYGMDVFLVGWLTREEFRRRASLIPSGVRVFQYSQTRTKNLAVPVADLKPLGVLLEKVKGWESVRSSGAGHSV